MSVHRDSQLDMFAKASPAVVKVRGPSRRPPSQPTARSDEDMARTLEESGNYRILRKLVARPIATVRRPGFPQLGVILDTETTGLSHRSDEIIEIGAVAFTFSDDGAIGDIVGIYGGLQQPSRPIPPEITRLTGITDAMVEGQVIDIQMLNALIEPADLIVAHNAGFDRPFCEAFSRIFAGKAWACSVSEVDWSARGFEGTKLGYLVGQAGYFHEGHRAVDDCHALLEILDREQGRGESPFAELYRASQRSRIRIFAEHSPFEMKDHLKARGYRWSDGSDGRLKSWWIEIDEESLDVELSYLRAEIYRWAEAEPPILRLTAFDRFKI
ncbi:DNA polymerase-3 subunit epsilon [Rhizobium pisi]|uniref:3'-5' exonuclease n=1 Tax=Rhizobium pisi TaxID=574561 RepID=A0A427N0W0_9HYPH|nr:3'-5' exonuclease [Rhizobium pisi]MBB3134570.1 DNA polymerase-3 subunit epsilon [Rhizobium pisi]RSB79472.1 3'-5' exonuclease [Rhizobium pisi]TCA59357.1 3'-5' exonuclease [Rhizobium pisi]